MVTSSCTISTAMSKVISGTRPCTPSSRYSNRTLDGSSSDFLSDLTVIAIDPRVTGPYSILHGSGDSASPVPSFSRNFQTSVYLMIDVASKGTISPTCRTSSMPFLSTSA